MKTIKLILIAFFGLFLGGLLGYYLEIHFLYSNVVFLTIGLAFIMTLIFSFAHALTEKTTFKIFLRLGYEMSTPFHQVVRQFKIDSILIAAIVFGFIGVLIYLETNEILTCLIIVLIFAMSYVRALHSYQKFGELR